MDNNEKHEYLQKKIFQKKYKWKFQIIQQQQYTTKNIL